MFNANLDFTLDVCTIQGGPSGRGIQYVDIKLKVPPQYKLLILKRNSYFNVNKRLSSSNVLSHGLVV